MVQKWGREGRDFNKRGMRERGNKEEDNLVCMDVWLKGRPRVRGVERGPLFGF